jgi:hypothetical protein
MWTLFLSSAFAGQLVVDAAVPAEVVINGQKAAELFFPGVLRLEVAPGQVPVTIFVDGKPQTVTIDVPNEGSAVLLVGKSGVTTGTPPDDVAAGAVVAVEFRVAGTEPLQLMVDDGRKSLSPGAVYKLSLASGDHKLSVRASDGTVIWARGTLALSGMGTAPVVVQIAEGRMPETTDGGAFRPDGG